MPTLLNRNEEGAVFELVVDIKKIWRTRLALLPTITEIEREVPDVVVVWVAITQ
jgi:hypothetical protein